MTWPTDKIILRSPMSSGLARGGAVETDEATGVDTHDDVREAVIGKVVAGTDIRRR